MMEILLQFQMSSYGGKMKIFFIILLQVELFFNEKTKFNVFIISLIEFLVAMPCDCSNLCMPNWKSVQFFILEVKICIYPYQRKIMNKIKQKNHLKN